jgi:hypothetical protein
MNRLDPNALFIRIAADIPSELCRHLFVTGSLAAAYHFQAKLEGRAIATKDADLVVHPAGDVESCRCMAKQLLNVGWSRTGECYPKPGAIPADALRAIRLFPPGSHDYFIEFLNLPQPGQSEPKRWVPVQMDDGWYGLPSFRFLGLTSLNRLTSNAGLEYASPSAMALANLLSHPIIGTDRIESGPTRGLLRSAKDLGRVIALARLAGRDETESWPPIWLDALKTCFPSDWRELAGRAGNGLMELLADENALEDARKTTDVGLLRGLDLTAEMLKATGERLLIDVIEPLAEVSGR